MLVSRSVPISLCLFSAMASAALFLMVVLCRVEVEVSAREIRYRMKPLHSCWKRMPVRAVLYAKPTGGPLPQPSGRTDVFAFPGMGSVEVVFLGGRKVVVGSDDPGFLANGIEEVSASVKRKTKSAQDCP